MYCSSTSSTATEEIEVKPLKDTPTYYPWSMAALLVFLWTAFWDTFWTYHRSILTTALIGFLAYVVYDYKLYTYRPEELLFHAKQAALKFRDTSLFFAFLVVAFAFIYSFSSWIYKRRQR